MTPFISAFKRTFWIVTDLDKKKSGDENLSPYPTSMEVCEHASENEANTISSLLVGGENLHAPCIDIDWHCEHYLSPDNHTLDVWCKWPKLKDDSISQEEITELRDQLVKYDFIMEVFFVGNYENIHYRFVFQPSINVCLAPSRSTDHFHLYIDIPLPWRNYLDLIDLLYQAGIVQKGFYRMSQARGMSHLRKPSSSIFQNG